MIIYDYEQSLSTLWWMHGSVVPKVLWVSLVCAVNGVIAVFFKDQYNLYITDTSHALIGTAVALLVVLKSTIAYQHFAAAKQSVYSFMDAVRALAAQIQVSDRSPVGSIFSSAAVQRSIY
jgi:predicted membrane chloride channel (bestrophin family)